MLVHSTHSKHPVSALQPLNSDLQTDKYVVWRGPFFSGRPELEYYADPPPLRDRFRNAWLFPWPCIAYKSQMSTMTSVDSILPVSDIRHDVQGLKGVCKR